MPVKDYIQKKKFSVTILLIVIVVTLITVGFVMPLITNPEKKVAKDTKTTQVGKLDANMLPSEFVKAFSEGSMYFKNWNWHDKMVQVIITDSSVSEDSMAGYIRNLTDKFPDRENRRFFNSCTPEQTFAVSNVNPTKSVLAKGFGLVSRASAGDILYTYCLDENCVNLGKSCVLIEF